MLKNNEKLQILNGKLSACRKVISTLKTDGWTGIIQPLMDKMITDIIGSKNGDFWEAGSIKKNPLEEKKNEYMLGYRQALVDFNNRVWSYKSQIDTISNKIVNVENKKDIYIQPMSDSKYAPTGDIING